MGKDQQSAEPALHTEHIGNFPTFGNVIASFMDGYPKRGTLKMDPVTKAEVLSALRKENYPIAESSLSEIYHSGALPRHPLLFIAVFSRIFDLNSGEISLLIKSAGLDSAVRGFSNKDPYRRAVHMADAITNSEEARESFMASLNQVKEGKRLPEIEDEELRAYYDSIKTRA